MVMRWFTREWHVGEIDDAAARRISDEYWEYIDRLAPNLPPSVVELAKEIRLHDGIFLSETFDLSHGSVDIEINCGDEASGYRKVGVCYRDAQLVGASLDQAKSWISAPETEILYDEVDVADNAFEHRMLLWPDGEFGIRFRDLALLVTPSVAHDRARN